jgi:signal transduction histidine kinase
MCRTANHSYSRGVSPRSRAWLQDHPTLVDSWCAAALLVVSVSVLAEDGVPDGRRWAAVVIVVLMTAPLALRRRAPMAVFVVIAGAAFVQWALRAPLGPADLALVVVLYTLAAHGGRRDALAATAVVLVGIAMGATRYHFGSIPGSLLGPAAIALAALALGDDLRNRRAYLAELEQHARRLEREREAETRAAVAAERSAVARELHDIVAHNLSVMVIQAEAATYAMDDDREEAERAMRAVTDTGRQALDEMRRLLDVLRPGEDERDRRPQPGLGEIADLVEGVRQAGVEVALSVEGEPRAVAPGVQLALYRIVQEALTNTLKHAGRGASGAVELRFDPASVSARVRDDGRSDGPTAPDERPGQGLVGMRERVAMYHGTLVSGPRPEGGFEVEASFPTRAGS